MGVSQSLLRNRGFTAAPLGMGTGDGDLLQSDGAVRAVERGRASAGAGSRLFGSCSVSPGSPEGALGSSPSFAGLAWPVAVAITYFAAQHALPQMMKDLIHPLQHYAAVNKVPYGYMNWGDDVRSAILDGSLPQTVFMLYVTSPPFLVSALPIIGAEVLVYSTIQTWKMRPAWAERWSYYVLVSACTTGLLLCVLGTRKDWSHLRLHRADRFPDTFVAPGRDRHPFEIAAIQ